MCGIIGLIGQNFTVKDAKKALKVIENRGKDSSVTESFGKVTFGHNLHAVVGHVKQPLVSDEGMLVANCEIYNWKQLAKKYKIKVQNDAQLILSILDKSKPSEYEEIIDSFDGDFAFAYYSKKNNFLILARDYVGVKPLVYYYNEKTGELAFASEKKALTALGLVARHLNPRKIIKFDLKKSKISFIERKGFDAFKIKSNNNKSKTNSTKNLALQKQVDVLAKYFARAVKKRIPNKKSALLLSGGLDSALIGGQLKKCKVDFECFFSCIKDPAIISEPADELFAQQTALLLGRKLNKNFVSLERFERELPKIISLIESTDPIRVGVASTLYFATEQISKQNIKVCFSGLGADELFAGYSRFKESTDVNKDCYSYFIKLYENDLYYQDIVCMQNNLELRLPFLDKELSAFALALPAKYKIANTPNGDFNKFILREFGKKLSLPSVLRFRPKKAAQYGSNFDKALEFLAKKNNFKSKAEYLQSISSKNASESKNIPIATLLSTGKDSLFAIHLMQKQGYEVKCLITIESKNKDSFMFHTPTTQIAKLQAKAIGIPLIIAQTLGEKEIELSDLKKAITLAVKKYGVEGVCSGALYSNYQRERIEKICEEIGVRSFAPLWHMDQITYLKQLVNSGFSAVITKIACFGLDEKWLGRKIDSNAINELKVLEKKYKINPAGEGGEYESLVLDAPLFKQKISLEFTKKMENEFTGEIQVTKAKLLEK